MLAFRLGGHGGEAVLGLRPQPSHTSQVLVCVCKASSRCVPDSPSPGHSLLTELLASRACQFATRDARHAKGQCQVSRVRSLHPSRLLHGVNLLNLPLELIELIVQFTADGLTLLPYRRISQLFNNLVLRHAFADFCPRTQNKFRALLQVCKRPRHLGGPPRIRRLAFPSEAEAMGIRSEEVIELLDLTAHLKSMATSWLFDLDRLQTIPRAFAELKHLCVYMQCSMRQVAWCMQLQQLHSLAITEVKVEEEGDIVEWMKEHRATSSIVKMRIGLQGDVLTDGFYHLLLTPSSLEGLTVFAASNVILQLVTSADSPLHQHKLTLSALSFYCFNRKPASALTPTAGSTVWFTQFPLLRQLCLCTSHIGALQGFYTLPNFLRTMIHSPLELFVLKGLWPPEPHGQLYQSVLDLIQTRTITSSLVLWTSSPLHTDDMTGLLEACHKNGIELRFWPCKDQYSCIV